MIDPNISLEEFVLINNVLKEFYDMKEEIKNSNYIQSNFVLCFKCRKNTESKNPKLVITKTQNNYFIKMCNVQQ